MPTDLFLQLLYTINKSCNNKPMQEYITSTQQVIEEHKSLIQSGKLLSYANCVSPIALHDHAN